MTTLVRVHQVLVNAPLQTVSDYVSNLTKHPEWSGGELKIEAVSSAEEFPDESEHAAEDHADEDAGDDGEVEAALVTLHPDVAGQAADPG